MAKVLKILELMRTNPSGVRFNDLQKVCEHYFGEARLSSGSHCIYKTPWAGSPRVNIQNRRGMGKPYQVKQALLAIEELEVRHGS